MARLKFAFQALVQLGQLLLPFCFHFLAQFPLDLAALLQIARFELSLRARIEAQTHLTHGRFRLGLEPLVAGLLAFAQNLLLLRVHLQPAFRVPPESLPLIRGKLIKTVASLIGPIAPSDSESTLAKMRSRLALSKNGARRTHHHHRGGCYNEELSSHRLLSSEFSNSSKSATTS